MQTFQVRVDEKQYACLNVVCSVARISGDTSAPATPTLTDSSVRGELPAWPSDVDIQRFYMVDQSELLSTHWIRLYLELVLCLKFVKLPKGIDVSSLEFVKVAIETDEETPLKAKSSVLYIAFKGLAVDGADESVEQRAIIKSVFNEVTGCLAVKGDLWKGEDYVAPMSIFERRLAYHLSRVRA
ncbi:UPF0725 protein EMB2204-like [Raphanus sativus]|uniref:UPF0725 protein EMB2204-like n=1 Tax=Raphanus sativus TaxID=3726 RepID=A0A9W3BXF9_RAPSA|nr:UPF0725 protein EMB2204-like [Raphanus sativus]